MYIYISLVKNALLLVIFLWHYWVSKKFGNTKDNIKI